MPAILEDDMGGDGKLSPRIPSPLPLRVLCSFTYCASTPGAPPPLVKALSTEQGPLVGPKKAAHRLEAGKGEWQRQVPTCQSRRRTVRSASVGGKMPTWRAGSIHTNASVQACALPVRAQAGCVYDRCVVCACCVLASYVRYWPTLKAVGHHTNPRATSGYWSAGQLAHPAGCCWTEASGREDAQTQWEAPPPA